MQIKRALVDHPLRLLVTGLLAALPLLATLAVLVWAGSLLLRFVGPKSPLGRWLGELGLSAVGMPWVGYVIAIAAILVGLLLLGALVEAGLERGLSRLADATLKRIPVVRTVYDMADKLVGLLDRRTPEATRALQPVWCRFGGTAEAGGTLALGLRSAAEPVWVQGRRCVVVIVPTAPVPVGGGLLFVPEDCVSPANLDMEALTSLYVSMGVTAPEHLGTPAAAPPQVKGTGNPWTPLT
jgi:uncharacterized membrane protein